MTDPNNNAAPVPLPAWNVLVDPGDEVSLFGKDYIFERIDPDHAFTFRAPAGAQHGDFLIRGDDGHPRKPNFEDIATIWREGNLVFKAKMLESTVRAFARQQKLDVEQARASDPKSQFRMAMCRRWDASPCALSENALKVFVHNALADPKIAAMPGAWPVGPTTLCGWIRERGTIGCRKEGDGVSMVGKMPRQLRVNHPLELVMYWAVRHETVRGDCRKNYDRYWADITKVNMGTPLNRNFLVDPDNEAGPCERPAEYPVPAKQYKAMSYASFWRLCRSLRSIMTYKKKTTAQAAYQRYGGGGQSDLPTHLGAFAWIDETPIPKAFFVDDRTGIPIGLCSMSLMLEHKSRAVIGGHISPGGPSASSILETVLHANEPKVVPEHLSETHADLAWMRAKPTLIGFDNSTAAHARSTEDVLADYYIAVRWFGSEMPRDKSHMERVIGTFLDLLFKHMSDANYDIARMRKYGFDPDTMVLCSIETARRLLNLAIMTYNVTRHRGLDGRQPALVWRQEASKRKLDKIEDVDGFREDIGDVDFDITLTPAGFEKFNRRFTAGAADMKRIIAQYERGTAATSKVSPGGKKTKQPSNSDDRKRLSFRVKGKYKKEDIGRIKIWNEYREPQQWEIFHCTDPNAHGTPKWLHDRCLELAKAEAMDYMTPEQQAYVRAKLFEDIANVDAKSSEQERRQMAHALSDPNTRRVMARYVDVMNEPVAEPEPPLPDEPSAVAHNTAMGKRTDASIPTPRSKPKVAPPAARMAPAASPPVTPARPASAANTKVKSDAGRSGDGRTNQTATGEQSKPQTRKRRNSLKWGDEF